MIKRYFTLLTFLLTMYFNGFAVTHTVTVQSNFFSPASMNVNVGDTVIYMWIGGNHTTTSTSVPAGAATWDSPMNPNVTSFSYVVTVPGHYAYKCTPHASFGMIGSFDALSVVGINEVPVPVLNLNTTVNNGTLHFTFLSQQNSSVRVSVYDLTGKAVIALPREVQPAGLTEYDLNLEALPKGYYILKFESGNQQFAKRFLVN